MGDISREMYEKNGVGRTVDNDKWKTEEGSDIKICRWLQKNIFQSRKNRCELVDEPKEFL